MTDHSFNQDVANIVGVAAATIYKNIQHWCEKNAVNERNIYDGKAWTYNSAKAYQKQFPYLSEKQIRTCLNKLIKHGFIFEGNFNKDARDRTKWYSVYSENCILPNGNTQLPKREDTTSQKVTPLPDIKPNIKPDIKQKEAKASQKAINLPDCWVPSQAGKDLASSLGVDWISELEIFTDYWIAVGGAKGRKSDWDATWRNWVRRAGKTTPRNSKPLSVAELAMRSAFNA